MKELPKIDWTEFRTKPRSGHMPVTDGFREIIQYLNALTDAVNELNEKLKEDHENAEGTQGTV